MSAEHFELTDFTTPVYLNYDQEKFWEIKLNEQNNEVLVRCGKLTLGTEDQMTIQALSKSHPNIVEAINYMEKHIKLKLSKGYKFTQKETDKQLNQTSFKSESRNNSRSAYSINIIPSGETPQENLLKRRRDEPLPKDAIKQTKRINPFEDYTIAELDQISFGDQTNQRNSIQSKSLSDSTINVNNEFKGKYLKLENYKGTQFFKVQILRKYIKIEKGFEDDYKTHEKEFVVCLDQKDAVNQAHKRISDYTSKGYKSHDYKFSFNFQESELDFKRSDVHNAPPSSPSHRVSNNIGNNNSQISKFQQSDYLGVNNNNGDDDIYSNTSLHSSFYFDDDQDDRDARTRSRGRSASAQRTYDNSDEDDTFSSNFLGDAPLGRPVSQNYKSVLLAHKWENEDPKGWFTSEKLDGVRCFWNGKTMWSRNGKQYFPPKFFTKDFPNSPLDGELWIGRSTFQKCVSVVRKQNPVDAEWRNVKYMVFDAPELKMPFKDRYKRMKEVFGKLKSPYIKLHEHYICNGRSHLDEELGKVQSMGGEGLMIRDPNSYYECRRSRTLLKVKTFDDDEAVIIGHEPGRGKYIGQTGALRVKNSKGVEFSVGSGMNDDMRARPPKIGTKITYKHQGVSNSGTPRFPTFVRVYTGY